MNNLRRLLTPLSIIVGAMIIGSFTASAIIFVNRDGASSAKKPADTELIETLNTEHAKITEADHIRGGINAPVKLIDYSDTECPYCKRHHDTLTDLFGSYSGEKVAWVYRHLPLDFHLQALPEAVATECVARLAGEDAFWTFLSRIYKETTSNDGLDLSLLPEFAKDAGVSDIDAFNSCYENQDTLEKVEGDLADAERAGGSGTPYSRLVSKKRINKVAKKNISAYLASQDMTGLAHFSKDGFAIGISGALPKEVFATLIDQLLAIN